MFHHGLHSALARTPCFTADTDYARETWEMLYMGGAVSRYFTTV